MGHSLSIRKFSHRSNTKNVRSLTLAIIADDGIIESCLNRPSIARNGTSITQPHAEQKRALDSFWVRHFEHGTKKDAFFRCVPHQWQNRASALFDRPHSTQLFDLSGDDRGDTTDTEARFDWKKERAMTVRIKEEASYRYQGRKEFTLTNRTRVMMGWIRCFTLWTEDLRLEHRRIGTYRKTGIPPVPTCVGTWTGGW